MSCQEVLSLLSAFIDGEMQAPQNAEQAADAEMVRQHLAHCASCAREFEALQRMAGMLAAAPEVEPPAFLLEQIEAATVRRPTFRARLRTALEPLLRLPGYARWGAVATAAAGVLIAVLMSQPGDRWLAHRPETAPQLPSASTVQPKGAEDSAAKVGPLRSAPDLGAVTIVERPTRTSHLHGKVRRRYATSAAKTLYARKATAKTPSDVEAAAGTGAVEPTASLGESVSVAESPAAATEAAVIASAPNEADLADEKAKTTKASLALEKLQQDKEALAELRAQIAARNRQRKHQVGIEAVGGQKYSVELASIRF